MNEEQRLEEFELSNRVIGASSCLLAFLSKNTDSNMGFQNHAYIIGTITD